MPNEVNPVSEREDINPNEISSILSEFYSDE